MNVFGIGLPEMAVIATIALLVFGPKKLPEVGRSLGKAVRGFQQAAKEFEDEFKREAASATKPEALEASLDASVDTPSSHGQQN